MAPPLPTIEFGVAGNKTQVCRLGLGTMGLSTIYGSVPSEEESVKVLNHAIDIGCTFWDTADIYGLGDNERLLSRVLKERRSEVFLCTKFGVVTDDSDAAGFEGAFFQRITGVSGAPAYARKCVSESLARLGTDHIDLYYLHRVDPNTPIEETVAAMAELVKEGKVRYLGISDCSADDLRRAFKVHPIAAVQANYSAWNTSAATNGLIAACRELGVTVVASCPLGTGALTGNMAPIDSMPDYDIRRKHPQFKEEPLERAATLVDALKGVANASGFTTSQVALAWLLAQDNVIPIPGTKRIEYLDENCSAAHIRLAQADLALLNQKIEEHSIH
ncbi:hypothetical protein IWW48_003481 [Coemansia sp. RSA 1200]|nr:hypothetical protein IWW48_003481 [Coemansia sp. RSA 1200]